MYIKLKKLFLCLTISFAVISCKTETKKTDTKVIDNTIEKESKKTQFSKSLSLNDINFKVSSNKIDNTNKLMISSIGLKNNYNDTLNIKNETVTNAEVADLNSDNYPELIIFTQANDARKKGNVYVFSAIENNSMIMTYFQPIEERANVNNGYKGHDEFAVVESKLVQRFPITNNGKEKIKQISYKLVNGEASRNFVVDTVDEMDK